VLVTSLALEILPCAFVECIAVTPGEHSGHAFCLEPLQAADENDSFHEAQIDFPVLLPGAPGLFPSLEARWHYQFAVAFTPDEFPTTIDHPPQLSL